MVDWNLNSVVQQLRQVREQSLEARSRVNRPLRMPSRKRLAEVIDQLSMALFPNRLGGHDRLPYAVDYYVGHLLERSLVELQEQVVRELVYVAETQGTSSESDEAGMYAQAVAIVTEFASRLPRVRGVLDADIRAAFEGDPAARSEDEVLICYPGLLAITHHRLAHELYKLGVPLVARIISEIAHSQTGIDIHPGAQIGGSVFIDHGTGVVIGETAIIGERVRLYQAVTLGAKRFPVDEHGVLLKGNARHPVVEDDVVIYAGATILGRITIGRGSSIGGNVWLTRSVPPNSHITQAKARTEDFDGGAGI